jgi:hypothetical protein
MRADFAFGSEFPAVRKPGIRRADSGLATIPEGGCFAAASLRVLLASLGLEES